jgi:hypothetical protein
MKTQIIRGICLVSIAALFALNIKGSKMQPSIEISIPYIHTVSTSFATGGNFKITLWDCCFMVIEHNSPMIPEPNSDHEFHSFDYNHHDKRTFWRMIASKVIGFIGLLHLLLIFLIKVSMVSRLLQV